MTPTMAIYLRQQPRLASGVAVTCVMSGGSPYATRADYHIPRLVPRPVQCTRLARTEQSLTDCDSRVSSGFNQMQLNELTLP